MSNKQDNTHASAAAAYGQKAKETATNQRELEGQLLIKYAQKMRALQDNWEDVSHSELDEVLSHNRKLWTLFYDTALEEREGDKGRPDELKQNIVALSEYIFNRTIKTLAAPEKDKLNILIDINKEIAAGLLAQQKQNDQETQSGPSESGGESSQSGTESTSTSA